MSRPNRGRVVFKVARAVLWAIQQTEWFSWLGFLKANPEYVTIRPGRILGRMVQVGILERDEADYRKTRAGVVMYRSLWLVKDRAGLEEKYGTLRKALTKKRNRGKDKKQKHDHRLY